MDLKNGPHTNRTHRLDQGPEQAKLDLRAVWWQRDSEAGPHDCVSVIVIQQGCATMQFDISPDEARSLAASLIKHADEVTATRQQIATA
jgi:hypothetical protein